jgi:oxygen-independent coproporphyrinogen-3 oxidase
MIEHLYIHVPFCVAKCRYCGFYSRAGEEPLMAAYVDAVLRELQPRTGNLRPRTIFFGGGTPSLLPVTLWEKFRFTPADEWTIECNPATVDEAKTRCWRALGVNRLSLGVQSFDDATLQVLGRVHTGAQAVETYRHCRAAGFANLNLDLMFALPGQTEAQWQATLEQAIALRPEHIATYCLTIEEDTDFSRTGVTPVPAEEQIALYGQAVATLTAAGYRHYEISNFALPGRECAHNIAYWEGRDYLGLGPSAVSTVDGRRWRNIADTPAYITGRAIVAETEELSEATRQSERVAFGLRMLDGVPAASVQGRWDAEIAGLLAEDLVQWRGDRLQLTARGLRYADEVASRFV